MNLNFLLAALLSFLASVFPKPATTVLVAPSVQIQNTAEMPFAAAQGKPPVSKDSTPWGTTEKIEEHLYRTYVGQDERMGTPDEILASLNTYRKNHNAGQLFSDEKLCALAQKRAKDQTKGLDKHQGLTEYLNNPDHWKELGLTAIGENASFGYVLSGVHLIEWVFDADEEHRSNQLSPHWTLACAAVSAKTVEILFGKR